MTTPAFHACFQFVRCGHNSVFFAMIQKPLKRFQEPALAIRNNGSLRFLMPKNLALPRSNSRSSHDHWAPTNSAQWTLKCRGNTCYCPTQIHALGGACNANIRTCQNVASPWVKPVRNLLRCGFKRRSNDLSHLHSTDAILYSAGGKKTEQNLFVEVADW